jgi:hypothetical protein
MSTPADPISYEERVVAVIDILGFSHLVMTSDGDAAALDSVRQLLRVDELFSKFLEFFPSAQGTFFSDTFVMSMQFPDVQTFYVVREIGYLCQYLLNLGLPCRGAISAGPLYHKAQNVVGPALVRAHELEQDKAKYPRVIFDEPALEHWKRDVAEGSSLDMFAPLVKRDDDGEHFIDIFSELYPTNFYQWAHFVEAFEPLPPHSEFIARAQRFVGERLEAYADNGHVLRKYQWLSAQLASYA